MTKGERRKLLVELRSDSTWLGRLLDGKTSSLSEADVEAHIDIAIRQIEVAAIVLKTNRQNGDLQ